MTRKEKLERIKKYRPSLYLKLKKAVPDLLANPENAYDEDIETYNKIIEYEAGNDTFRQNFSFWS